MTRVRIAPPDTEEDVSAEQLADYALRVKCSYTRAQLLAVFATYAQSDIEGWIRALATEEGRHPSAVLADIVGPARAASVGVACVTGESLDQRVSRTRCAMRAATDRHARRLRLERATEDADSAARGAGEESE